MSVSPLPVAELPAPSAELVLIRVLTSAYLATCHVKPHRRAKAFLRAATKMLASEESASAILPIRPNTQLNAVAVARRQAVALFRQYIPMFTAAGLMDDDI